MLHEIIKYFASISLNLCIVITSYSVNAQNETNILTTDSPPQIQLKKHLQYYRNSYPEISFLLLQGGSETFADMLALDLVLGFKPSNMDYEHPPESREDLMFVSVWRIMRMLQSKAPSASLFKADTPLGWQEPVCVLTIDPDEVAANSLQATQNLLELPSKVIQKIPQSMLLTADDYLAFVIDHEVYHCLQAMYDGPQLMSEKPLWSDYNNFIDEQGADAYALGMHIKSHSKNTAFNKNIKRIRGMSLYNIDPNHLTVDALNQVNRITIESFYKMNVYEIFEMAISIKEFFTIGYEQYTQYLASSLLAMKEIGIKDSSLQSLHKTTKDFQSDPDQVQELVTNSRQCLAELISKGTKS